MGWEKERFSILGCVWGENRAGRVAKKGRELNYFSYTLSDHLCLLWWLIDWFSDLKDLSFFPPEVQRAVSRAGTPQQSNFSVWLCERSREGFKLRVSSENRWESGLTHPQTIMGQHFSSVCPARQVLVGSSSTKCAPQASLSATNPFWGAGAGVFQGWESCFALHWKGEPWNNPIFQPSSYQQS